MSTPPPADTVSALREGDAGRTEEALAILSRVFGYDSFRGEQAAIIDQIGRAHV